MVSVASGGTADRIAARSFMKVLRVDSGTLPTYSSTFFGAPRPVAAGLRLRDLTFFTRAMLQEPPLGVHAPRPSASDTPQPISRVATSLCLWEGSSIGAEKARLHQPSRCSKTARLTKIGRAH